MPGIFLNRCRAGCSQPLIIWTAVSIEKAEKEKRGGTVVFL